MTRRALPKLARRYATVIDGELGHRPTKASIGPAAEVVIRAGYHEAAHAVVGAYFGEMPVLATIERGSESMEGSRWGFVRWRRIPVRVLIEGASGRRARRLLRRRAEEEAMVSLAGIAVEQTRDPEALDLSDALWEDQEESGRTGDVGSALDALAAFERDEDKRQCWVHELAERTVELVAKPEVAAMVEKLAESLLDTPTLEGDRLERILMPVFSLWARSAI